jgi:hypothetical protein
MQRVSMSRRASRYTLACPICRLPSIFTSMGVVEGERELQIPRLRSPGFPAELVGVGEPHAAFLTESRTRSHEWSNVQEIRVGMTKGEGSAYLGRGYRGTERVGADGMTKAEGGAYLGRGYRGTERRSRRDDKSGGRRLPRQRLPRDGEAKQTG